MTEQHLRVVPGCCANRFILERVKTGTAVNLGIEGRLVSSSTFSHGKYSTTEIELDTKDIPDEKSLLIFSLRYPRCVLLHYFVEGNVKGFARYTRGIRTASFMCLRSHSKNEKARKRSNIWRALKACVKNDFSFLDKK